MSSAFQENRAFNPSAFKDGFKKAWLGEAQEPSPGVVQNSNDFMDWLDGQAAGAAKRRQCRKGDRREGWCYTAF